MLQIIKTQAAFLVPCLVFLLLGAVLLLNIEKGDFIFFFNERRSLAGDLFFAWGTKLGEFVPYILGLLLLIYWKRYAYAIAIPVLAITVSIVSYLSKSFFAHYRPYTIFKQEGILDQIQFIEGISINKAASSFPSGHTMSAFAIYCFLSLVFPEKKYLGLVFFVLALIVGLSRVYLVQHFFQDIYLGAILGIFLAFAVYLSTVQVETRFRRRAVKRSV